MNFSPFGGGNQFPGNITGIQQFTTSGTLLSAPTSVVQVYILCYKYERVYVYYIDFFCLRAKKQSFSQYKIITYVFFWNNIHHLILCI